jgi:Fis family transcriptional regulator, factor for inversion stimulation protein
LQLDHSAVTPHANLREKQEGDLSMAVRRAVRQYFKDLDGEQPAAIHDMVLSAIERPLLEEIMDRAAGNQTRAAAWLGMTRTTLRKKLAEYGMAH